jgi:hypothetical protein
VDPQLNGSPHAALAEAARALIDRKLGRAKLPCQVVVRFSGEREFEGVAVEVIGAPASADGRITDCLRDVIDLLARTNHRLTTSKIIDGLTAQGTPYGDSTVKATLAQAVRDEVLTSKPDAKPPGYGLPRWP